VPDATPTLCAWHPTMGQTPVCTMPASVSSETTGAHRRWYCLWHHMALTTPRWVDDYQQFELWCQWLAAKRVCAVWTHFPPEDLWRGLRGMPLVAQPACKRLSCSLFEPEGRRTAPVASSDAQTATRIVQAVVDRELPVDAAVQRLEETFGGRVDVGVIGPTRPPLAHAANDEEPD
jgi:hypothetical protein